METTNTNQLVSSCSLNFFLLSTVMDMALELIPFKYIDFWKNVTEKGHDVKKAKQYLLVHREKVCNVINCDCEVGIGSSRENSF
jgi:hypothetical protein